MATIDDVGIPGQPATNLTAWQGAVRDKLHAHDTIPHGQIAVNFPAAGIPAGHDNVVFLPSLAIPFTAKPADVWQVSLNIYVAAATGAIEFAPCVVGATTDTIEATLLPMPSGGYLPWYAENGMLGVFPASSAVVIPAGITGPRRFAIRCKKTSAGTRNIAVTGVNTILTATYLGTQTTT